MRTPERTVTRMLNHRTALLMKPPTFEVHGTAAFDCGWELCVPSRSGIYLISDLRGPLYVGKTVNLRSRFAQHLNYSHNPLLRIAIANPVGAIEFRWMLAGAANLGPLEAEVIDAFQPLCNKTLTVLTIDHRDLNKYNTYKKENNES